MTRRRAATVLGRAVRVAAAALLAASLTVGATSAADETSRGDAIALDHAVATGRLDRAVRTAVSSHGASDALVTVRRPSPIPSGPAGPKAAPDLSAAAAGAPAAGAPAASFPDVGRAVETLTTYASFPVRLVRVHGLAALVRLAARPEVVGIHADVRHPRALAESLPLIHQPQAQAKGWTGAGTAVAVIDTGVDWTETSFYPGAGGCTAVGQPSGCRVTAMKDFAPADGQRDDSIRHGTNVAGIVLGVAPDTRILGLDVFDGDGATDDSILGAIDWTIANRATYHTRVITMSLGGGEHFDICDGVLPDYVAAVSAARDAGILTVVAAGNGAVPSGTFEAGISAPACIAETVSVGAVYDGGSAPTSWGECTNASSAADRIPCWSQSGPALKVLAPGALITSAGVTMAGTSQATPHVAGAIADLWDARPTATPAQVETAVLAAGPLIADARSGVSVHRLDVDAAGVLLTTGSSWSAPTTIGNVGITSVGAALARTVNGTTPILHAVGVANVVNGAPIADGGPFRGVMYWQSSDNGAHWTPVRRLNPMTTHGARVAIGAGGANVYVAWVETQVADAATAPTKPRRIWVRVSLDHGVTWAPAIPLSSATGRVDIPTVAATGAKAFVTWTDSDTGAIRLARTTDGGVHWALTTLGTTTIDGPQGRSGDPSVAASGLTVAVSWIDGAPTAGRVRARVSTDAGVVWQAATSVATSGAYAATTAVSAGRVGVAWDGGTTIKYRQLVSGTWEATRTVGSFGTAGGYWPAVALQANGRVGIAWTHCSSGACDRSDVMWSESTTNGASWATSRVIIDSASSSSRRINDFASVVWPSATTRYVIHEALQSSGSRTSSRLALHVGTGAP